ncbi:serine hydrolase domain-containing protein [Luteimonas kalidii]|uniref:Serine hydrolase n=1 Tax=Luteimonas kalidii TaxID=3042025 RepID=A0ABT6JXQ5_9GAMM|nr:serine hydrolase domain-containing protein [Luteimonas kalidii]MDH5835260.1 serine hydrolase [Luteimonas kalidii]
MPNRRLALAMTLACLLALAPPCVFAQAPPSDAPVPAGASIDARIRQQMAQGGIVGMAAAIIVDGRVAWRAGYGHANREAGTPFTPETVMNIASISKTITGAAMMRAVEQGQLSLDADIQRAVPFPVRNPHRPGPPITLRHLATHTSGITDRWAVYSRGYHFGRDAPQPLGGFLAGYFTPGGGDYADANFLEVAPGTHREYSNIGAALAGHAVERATGQSLDAYTREHFFVPLGMARTRWFMADAPMDDHATLYVSQDGMQLPIQPYGLVTWPDGGLRTSVDDLSKFFIALLQGGEYEGTRVLSRESVLEMTRLQFTANRKPDNVDVAEKNSGLFWQTKFNTRFVGHGGGDPGLRTEMLASPALDTGVIVFTNTSGEDSVEAYVAIFEALWAHAQSLRPGTP